MPHGILSFSVDFGTSSTVCAARTADGAVRPLLFDGSPLLPSAVYLDGDGAFHVGRDARIMAHVDPARLEPHPKRHIGTDAVLLGDTEVRAADLLTAVFAKVRDEARSAFGVLPPVVLTCPAKWGPRNRAALASAAAAAGLEVRGLVAEPVAASAYFNRIAEAADQELPVAVYDLGAGTFDLAVLGPDSAGRPVIAQAGLSDLGGIDIDQALTAHVGALVAAERPELWERLSDPSDALARRERQTLLEAVREAKEMLSRTASAPLAVPGFERGLHLTRDEVERLALPMIARTADLCVRVLAAAGIEPGSLGGFFLTGGASRMPLVGRVLHQRLGIGPTLIEQPELTVAFGALDARIEEQPGPAAVASEPSPPPIEAEAPGNAPAEQGAGPARPEPGMATAVLPPHEASRPAKARRIGAVAAAVVVIAAAVIWAAWDWGKDDDPADADGSSAIVETPGDPASSSAPPGVFFDQVALWTGDMSGAGTAFEEELTAAMAADLPGFTITAPELWNPEYMYEPFDSVQYQLGMAANTHFDPDSGFMMLGNVVPFSTWTVIASADSGIETFADLAGKQVVTCFDNEGYQANCELSGTLLDAAGVEPGESITAVSAEATDMLISGEIDAVIQAEALPNYTQYWLDHVDVDLNTVGIPDEALDALPATYTPLAVEPDGEYIDSGFETATGWLALYADESMEEDQAYQITKALYDNIGGLNQPAAQYASIDHALDGVPDGVALHPGAEQYFQELGLL